MTSAKTYTAVEVAKLARVSRKTVLRWCAAGKVPEPRRDRNGWRAWTEADVVAVIRYATQLNPPPSRVGSHGKRGSR